MAWDGCFNQGQCYEECLTHSGAHGYQTWHIAHQLDRCAPSLTNKPFCLVHGIGFIIMSHKSQLHQILCKPLIPLS